MELETIKCCDYCISKIDSVNSLNVTRIDSLENLLNNHMISEKYFQDITPFLFPCDLWYPQRRLGQSVY